MLIVTRETITLIAASDIGGAIKIVGSGRVREITGFGVGETGKCVAVAFGKALIGYIWVVGVIASCASGA